MIHRLAPLPVLSLVILGIACSRDSAPPPPTADEVALELHHDAIVVDTHSDTTPRFDEPDWDFAERHEAGHQDLPRMREGGLDVQFWSIYMGRTEGEGTAVRKAIERIDAVHELVRKHPEELGLATTAEEVRTLVANGRIACLMGIEGGHIIEESLPALRTFYRLGVRYLTLTHSFNTSWADSSGTNEIPEPLHHGLTPFGEDVVREMNHLGMMVDVSHVSDETFWDVLRVSRAPVIASHSSARAVADHPRNMSDDMLRALAEGGGVIMINFYSGYIDTSLVAPIRELMERFTPQLAALREQYAGDPRGLSAATRGLFADLDVPRTSLSVLLDHFDHAIEVAGPDHVGLGGDWDGVLSMPEDMGDVSKLPNLTRGLLERGHSVETIRKVLGENLLRVLEEVEHHAAR
jgi:membrane dipeptidase